MRGPVCCERQKWTDLAPFGPLACAICAQISNANKTHRIRFQTRFSDATQSSSLNEFVLISDLRAPSVRRVEITAELRFSRFAPDVTVSPPANLVTDKAALRDSKMTTITTILLCQIKCQHELLKTEDFAHVSICANLPSSSPEPHPRLGSPHGILGKDLLCLRHICADIRRLISPPQTCLMLPTLCSTAEFNLGHLTKGLP